MQHTKQMDKKIVRIATTKTEKDRQTDRQTKREPDRQTDTERQRMRRSYLLSI